MWTLKSAIQSGETIEIILSSDGVNDQDICLSFGKANIPIDETHARLQTDEEFTTMVKAETKAHLDALNILPATPVVQSQDLTQSFLS